MPLDPLDIGVGVDRDDGALVFFVVFQHRLGLSCKCFQPFFDGFWVVVWPATSLSSVQEASSEFVLRDLEVNQEHHIECIPNNLCPGLKIVLIARETWIRAKIPSSM